MSCNSIPQVFALEDLREFEGVLYRPDLRTWADLWGNVAFFSAVCGLFLWPIDLFAAGFCVLFVPTGLFCHTYVFFKARHRLVRAPFVIQMLTRMNGDPYGRELLERGSKIRSVLLSFAGLNENVARFARTYDDLLDQCEAMLGSASVQNARDVVCARQVVDMEYRRALGELLQVITREALLLHIEQRRYLNRLMTGTQR